MSIRGTFLIAPCLFALLQDASAIAAVSCPAIQYPVADVAAAIGDSDAHAWQLFLALNRPADLGKPRGTPDSQKKIGDPGKVVWETWKLARTEVFKEDGSDPGDWNTAVNGLVKLVDPPKASIVMGNLAPRSPKARILFDPGETNNETRMNCETYKFVVENELYNIEGQEIFMNSTDQKNKLAKFPTQSMEVKASWREFTSSEMQTDLPKRYYTFTDESGKTWGLATLHIVTKEIPNWFWTSFRQKEGPPPLYPKGDSAGLPKELIGTVWQNYELSGTQTDFVDTIGRPIILSDPIIEAGFEKSSCMSCHAHAGIRRIVNGRRDEMPFSFGLDMDQQLLTPFGSPDPRLFLENFGRTGVDQSVFQQDFLFSLRRAHNKK
jgi:hypothetical protein